MKLKGSGKVTVQLSAMGVQVTLKKGWAYRIMLLICAIMPIHYAGIVPLLILTIMWDCPPPGVLRQHRVNLYAPGIELELWLQENQIVDKTPLSHLTATIHW